MRCYIYFTAKFGCFNQTDFEPADQTSLSTCLTVSMMTLLTCSFILMEYTLLIHHAIYESGRINSLNKILW